MGCALLDRGSRLGIEAIDGRALGDGASEHRERHDHRPEPAKLGRAKQRR
jgi:hypothetical protein